MHNQQRFIMYQVSIESKDSDALVSKAEELIFLSPDPAFHTIDIPFWQAIDQAAHQVTHQSTQATAGRATLKVIKELSHIGELEQVPSNYRNSLSPVPVERRRILQIVSSYVPISPFEFFLSQQLAGRRLILTEIESAYAQHFSSYSTFTSIGSSSSSLASVAPIAPLSHVPSISSITPITSVTPVTPALPVSPAQPTRSELLCTLQRLYLLGFIEWLPAIGYKQGAYGLREQAFCRRCGYHEETKSFFQRIKSYIGSQDESLLIPMNCAVCGQKTCLYCPRCLQLGVAKSCEPYISWQQPSYIPQSLTNTTLQKLFSHPVQGWTFHVLDKNSPLTTLSVENGQRTVQFQWDAALSEVQQRASDQLLAYVKNRAASDIPEFLVWAICGAGKTEIIFATLYDALSQGQKLLLTSPRKDVILELAPRLKSAFPTTKIVVLHGDSQEKYEQGDLFLATTHQCLRFYQYFDLVVVDEVDAFPYSYDQMLQYAVQRAKKEEGMLIYLSATPSEAFQRRAEKGLLPHVLISKRYHGKPLAVPRIKAIGKWRSWMRSKVVSSELVQFVAQLMKQKRYGYLFVPHVQDLPVVQSYLQAVLLPYLERKGVCQERPFLIETVYAEHPERTAIVQRFRQHEIDLLLTTTILERGVTIPFCDVAVLGSDDQVFHTAALIQMAGRAGRKIQDPIGEVTFFPESVTKAQIQCVRQIKKWNEE